MKDEKKEARPTWFESTLYRSQIEARWALFFKCMDIEVKYEERYFDLDDGIFYKPDLWLPKQNCWFEVKGAFPAKEKREKARRLAIYTKTTVYIAHGLIPEPDPVLESWYAISALVFFPDGNDDEAYWWCECPVCGTVGMQSEGRAFHLPCGCLSQMGPHLDRSNYYYSPRLLKAYWVARSAEVDKESMYGHDHLVDR